MNLIHLTRAGFEDQTYCGHEAPSTTDGLTTDPDLCDCPNCLRLWTSWTKHLTHANRTAGINSWPDPPKLMLLDTEPVEIDPNWTIITAEDPK